MGKQSKSLNKILSASKIKTLEDCSWIYWCKYHLNLPDTANEGSARGTICHLIFELFLKQRHEKYYHQILGDKSFENCPAIKRLVSKHLRSYNFETKENYDLIEKMVVVGLSYDFFEEKGQLGKAEESFLIENKRLKYKIRGFIDKHAFYDDTLIITDYKSSKAKFKGEGLSANIQAMMYTLAGRKFRKGIKRIIVRFMFLRFPRSAIQEVEFTKDEISGFEHYLSSLHEILEDFDELDAKSNYAADKYDTKWFCSAGRTWVCPLKNPFDYYALIDEDGKVLKTSKEDDLELKEKCEIKKMAYTGCPRYYPDGGSEAVAGCGGLANPKVDPFNFK